MNSSSTNILDRPSSSDNKTPLFHSNSDEQTISGYNPFQYPADIAQAKRHQLATRVKKPSDPSKRDPCECCDRDTNAEMIPLCCKLEELYPFRYCTPLFFQFSLFCIISLSAMLALFGFWSLYQNYQGNSDKVDSRGFTHRLHVLGVNLKEDLYKQAFLILMSAGFLVGMRGVFKGKQKKVVLECDSQLSSASDYAIRVTGLKGIKVTEEELKSFFVSHTESKEPDSVKKVVFAYDIEELTNLLRQKLNLQNLKKKILEESQLRDFSDKMTEEEKTEKLKDIDQEQTEVEAKIKEKVQNGLQGLSFTGTAFVIFNKQADAKNIKNKWKKLRITWFFIKLFFCCFRKYQIKGKFIKVQYAPDPGDIIWENSAYSWNWKLFQTIKGNMTTIIATVIAALVQLGLSYYKHKKVGFLFPLLSTISSFVIVTVNSILVIIIKKAASAERHFTYTNYHQSVAEKLIKAQFINSAAIPICVNFLMHFIPGQEDDNLSFISILDGLATDMFYVFVSNAISTPLALFFDPVFMFRAFKQGMLEIDNKALLMTQNEVHALFEFPQFDASSKYSANIKTMWMTAFFAPLLPICIPISLIGLILKYWVDKFIFLRRNSAPQLTSEKMAKAMINYFEMTPFWLGLGCFLINKFYDPDPINEVYNWGVLFSELILIGSLVSSLLPKSLTQGKVRSSRIKKKNVSKTMPYQEAHLLFETDYDRTNPVTKAAAEEALLIDCIQATTDDEIKKDLQEALEELKSENQSQQLLGSALGDYVCEQTALEDAYNYKSYFYGGGEMQKPRKRRHKGYRKFKKEMEQNQLLENNPDDTEANQEIQQDKKKRRNKNKGERNRERKGMFEGNPQHDNIYDPHIDINLAL